MISSKIGLHSFSEPVIKTLFLVTGSSQEEMIFQETLRRRGALMTITLPSLRTQGRAKPKGTERKNGTSNVLRHFSSLQNNLAPAETNLSG